MGPILLNLSLPIKTKNLSIRPVMPGDGPIIYEAFKETEADLNKWLSWSLKVKKVEDIEKTCREFYAKFILRNEFHFAIFMDEKYIGSCSLHKVDWNILTAEVGYWLRKTAQGQGYVREAIAALSDYANKEMGIKKLSIIVDDENTKSASVPEAIGYTLEAKIKGLISIPGFNGLRLSRLYTRYYD
jgi:RimJ/RimL family protein N-acetyltransferase